MSPVGAKRPGQSASSSSARQDGESPEAAKRPGRGASSSIEREDDRRLHLAPSAFERRPWGGFLTLDKGPGYQVKQLVVEPGHRFSYQKHRFRAEHWVVVAGSPRVILNGRPRRLKAREWIMIPRGAWHRAENPGRVPVVIIEVQHGSYLGEDDIVRLQDDYGRTPARPAAATPAGRRRPAR
jgi:mannose-6-phosphate isomerase-like protein (cupin superfamily)